MTKLQHRKAICLRSSAKLGSPTLGRAASVSAHSGKGVTTQTLWPRGAFSGSPAPPEGCPFPAPARTRPPPRGSRGLPGLQTPGRGDRSGGRYLGAVLQRLLQQELVHGGHGGAGPGRRTEGGRRDRRGCFGLKRRGERSVPAAAPSAPTAGQ